MRLARNIAWWLCFFLAGVYAQSILSGIDFLLIGVIIALQERRPVQLAWVILAAILLQEGVGTLPFGSALLFYVFAIIVFYGGRALFEAENFFFIFLVSALLGLLHFIFTFAIADLHSLHTDITRLGVESVIQALLIPPLWRLAYFLRGKEKENENRA
ncbi:MAG: hypothetical protein IJD04_00695 [Desulfovibrionaceae bacterium]|nr:hypothetical protein [Desulfovibrionaceae bacterium]